MEHLFLYVKLIKSILGFSKLHKFVNQHVYEANVKILLNFEVDHN